MVTFVAVWAVLAIVVLALALWRNLIGLHEDDTVHIADAKASNVQETMARKISAVDRWGKSLTVVTVVYGLTLAGIYLYNFWVESGSRLPSS